MLIYLCVVLRRVDNQCQKVWATTHLFRPCPVLSHCQKMAFDWYNLVSNRNRLQALPHRLQALPHRYAYFKLPKVYSFYTALVFYWDMDSKSLAYSTDSYATGLIAQTSNARPVLSCWLENHWRYRQSLKS